MLRFLRSLVGAGERKAGYPESLVKDLIERAVDATDPWLRAVSGYRKKLRPAVIRSLDHVTSLMGGLPSPIPLCSGCYDDDPFLKALFASKAEMRTVLRNDRNLAVFRKGLETVPQRIIALLIMEKKESAIFGVEMTGDVVARDVCQETVSFVAHRFVDPAADEGETRRLLRFRAFDRLISIALKRITGMKVERKDLEGRRNVLQGKLDLLQQGGWGFEGNGSERDHDMAGLEEGIGRINSRLSGLGGNDRMLECYLDALSDVLGHPEDHLWGKKETVVLDSMGIKRSQPGNNAHELTFVELENSTGRRLIIALVDIAGDELEEGICWQKDGGPHPGTPH